MSGWAHLLHDALFGFAFYYPLFMAYLWMVGGIYYTLHWERRDRARGLDNPPPMAEYPGVSILIPCHNEGPNVRQTVRFALATRYPDFEVIAVDDGSSDDTGAILDELAASEPRLRVVHLAANQGKAVGLITAALLARNEFLLCIDGDALLDPNAAAWMMRHFVGGPRVAAVTGNPRIRNRSTLLGKIQVGEFSSIIGLIKRAQRIYGRIFTVSGVITAFRRSALHRVGYWSEDMVTEDIDISWKLQLDHWDVRYEPNALAWILMPETVKGLWRQRVRWAQGGAEVLLKYFRALWSWRKRRMWPVYVELAVSVLWAHVIAATIGLWALGHWLTLPAWLEVPTLLPQWTGVLLGFTCLLQFCVALVIDSRYERQNRRYFYWMIWYPMLYWVVNLVTTLAGFWRALLRRRGQRAIWVSPDRGLGAEAAP